MERFPYNSLNAENVGLSNFADLYGVINQINLMIAKTTETQLLPEVSKNYYLGEAYGMRAFLYFHLLRSWGDVILHLDYTSGSTIDLANILKLNVMDCFSCKCCEYICSSKIPLVSKINAAKGLVMPLLKKK